MGYSIGGLVSLFARAKDWLMFDRIFLSAPMVALDRQPLSMAGMARVAEVLSFVGLGRMLVSRNADRPASEATFPDNPLTGDMIRYLRKVDVMKARPALEIGASTVR
ncbi:MAG: hypothetical protein MO846_03100 [Candidatus Devosia symbiotica]|nr:hypothetical protein [Candidatus Devosia symbiotica]